jgi:1,4-dihydroxy-2-naphthoate octaprenyltransferase
MIRASNRSDTPRSRLGLWVEAARPKTLWAGIVPVLIGIAMALGNDVFHWPSALFALLGSLLIQIGTNFANDYSDFVKGADTEQRIGPRRITQAGLVSPIAVRNAAILVFGLAVVSGGYLIVRGGWPILLIGVLSIVSGWLYTGGPRPLGYVGLGDLFVLVFFGPIAVGGTYYVQALSIAPSVVAAGFSPGLLSVAVLVVNNLRDIRQDELAGKRTLAVRFGASFARKQYAASIALAVAIPVAMALLMVDRLALIGCLAVLPVAWPTVRRVYTTEGQELNPLLAATARLLLVYGLLFSVGWMLNF